MLSDSRLLIWSKPIIDRRLMTLGEIEWVKRRLEAVERQLKGGAYGYVHGNIIGDHIILAADGGKPYLLDLEAVSRIAPEYYDVLRAVDFLLLTAADANHTYEKVRRGFLSWCVSDYLPEEIHAVMAFRLIGALGWNLLEHDASYIPERAKEERIKLMLRLIREGIG